MGEARAAARGVSPAAVGVEAVRLAGQLARVVLRVAAGGSVARMRVTSIARHLVDPATIVGHRDGGAATYVRVVVS